MPFTYCISKINNTQIGNVEDIDVVMPIYNLIEYSDNYSEIRITGETTATSDVKNVKISVSLKYLTNFWKSREMLLFNCEINLILT